MKISFGFILLILVFGRMDAQSFNWMDINFSFKSAIELKSSPLQPGQDMVFSRYWELKGSQVNQQLFGEIGLAVYHKGLSDFSALCILEKLCIQKGLKAEGRDCILLKCVYLESQGFRPLLFRQGDQLWLYLMSTEGLYGAKIYQKSRHYYLVAGMGKPHPNMKSVALPGNGTRSFNFVCRRVPRFDHPRKRKRRVKFSRPSGKPSAGMNLIYNQSYLDYLRIHPMPQLKEMENIPISLSCKDPCSGSGAADSKAGQPAKWLEN